MSEDTAPTPKSDALKNLETNLDQIVAFIKRIGAEEFLRTTEALREKVSKELAATPKGLDAIRLELDTYSALAHDWLEFRKPALRWMSVMLVSFLEAYLEDGLREIATKNPKVVENSKIDPMRVFEVGTIEEMRSEVTANWAHNTIRPDGPITWRKRLRELGAPQFDDKVIANLQHLWDTRNLIVHSSCVADGRMQRSIEIWELRIMLKFVIRCNSSRPSSPKSYRRCAHSKLEGSNANGGANLFRSQKNPLLRLQILRKNRQPPVLWISSLWTLRQSLQDYRI